MQTNQEDISNDGNGKIYALNARDNVILPVIYKSCSNMYKEINDEFKILLNKLKNKGIDYYKLSKALTPVREEDKYEYAFVFNSRYFDDKTMFYGEKIINKILSIINKESTQSILFGDYIKLEEIEESTLKEIFLEKIEYINKCEYAYSIDYFIVYINNISKKQVNDMINILKKEEFFVGVMNLKYCSRIKQYFSTILCPLCLKYKNKVVIPSIQEDNNNENFNEQGYAYKENGFEIISLNEMWYYLFLSYKIPNCTVDKEDLKFNYNVLTNIVPEYKQLKIIVDENKLKYLKREKAGDMKILDLLNITKEDLEKMILINLYNNYIYNLEINSFGDLKFNILIELYIESQKAIKNVLIALKYIPEKKEIRLITMF